MFKDITALREEREQVIARGLAIVDLAKEQNRDLSEDEQKEIDGQDSVLAEIDSKIQRLEKIEARQKQIADKIGKQQITSQNRIVIPAKAKVHPKLQAFKGETAQEDAYISGHFAAACLYGSKSSREWLANHGIDIRAAHSTSDNEKGGYLVPDPMEAAIIRQVEEAGVFRRNVGRVWPMPNGSTRVPKRNGGFTGYWVGENSTITASDLAFANVALSAKKPAILTQISSELSEDSLIELGDFLATEIAYKFALMEDDAGFNGDGTATYGGITGLEGALLAGCIATAEANDNTLAELTVTPIHEAMGKLARYAGIMPKWYMHSSVWENGFKRLAFAANGNDAANFGNGLAPVFMGYPVEFVQVMPSGGPSTDLASTIVAYFGDLAMTCSMGQARGVTVASDSSLYFAQDALAVRGTERIDIVVHEVGTASVAGSMVAVKMNAA